MAYTYEYPRPMVTVDAAVFTVHDGALEILLIQRGHEPAKGKWALPGGFLEMDEELVDAAARELKEETGISGIALVLAGVFGTVGRDPRGRVITMTFVGLVDWREHAPKGGDDAVEARWFAVSDLPEMAFDHIDMIACCRQHFRMVLGQKTPSIVLPASITREMLSQSLQG